MKEERKPYFGFPQEKSRGEIINGLNEAVEATKGRIEEYKSKNWDTSELKEHLKKLRQQLKSVDS